MTLDFDSEHPITIARDKLNTNNGNDINLIICEFRLKYVDIFGVIKNRYNIFIIDLGQNMWV